MKKTWICHVCSFECKSIPEWQDHLCRQHDTAFSGPLAQVALDAAEKRSELEIKDQQCPFCLSISAITRRDFVTHVGRHMEEVALATLPIDEPSDASDAGSIANDKADSGRLKLDAADAVSDSFPSTSRPVTPAPGNIPVGNVHPHPRQKPAKEMVDVEEIWKVGERAAEKMAKEETTDEAEEKVAEERSAADQSRDPMSTYFLEGTGIDREVITTDICRYLGNSALVRPGTYEVGDGLQCVSIHNHLIMADRLCSTQALRKYRTVTISLLIALLQL
jgi:hypothetical protein